MALPAVALARGAEPPDNVAQAVADAEQKCKDSEGAPNSDAVLTVADVNRDGGEDWIVDYSKLKCDGGINPMCGDEGCTLQIYLWDGAMAWNLAFEETVRGYKFGNYRGRPVLNVTYPGDACGGSAAKTCKVTYWLELRAIAPLQ
jgi:hypothetical protein